MKKKKSNEVKIYKFKGDNPYGLYIAGIDHHRPSNPYCISKMEIYEKGELVATYNGKQINNKKDC